MLPIDVYKRQVLNSCAYLETQGFEVTYLDVDEWGCVRFDALQRAIRKDTILISIMYANNEVGTIQPIGQIGKIAKENDIFFHTDAVQAYGQIPIDVKRENIHLLSASAHKMCIRDRRFIRLRMGKKQSIY